MTCMGPEQINGLDDDNDLSCVVGFGIMIISIAIILLSVVLYIPRRWGREGSNDVSFVFRDKL